MMWKDISTAPKDGTRILVKDHNDDHIYITEWIYDVYTYQGGKGGPSGWFSGKYYDNWGDQPEMDVPRTWTELPL